MAAPLKFDMESPAWLRKLRWAAIVGMFASVSGAHMLGVVLPLAMLYGMLFFLSIWNLLLPVMENRFSSTSKNFIFLQIIVDLCVLTFTAWFSGGLLNPFNGFYLIHVLIAGLLLNPMFTALISAFAAACVLFLISAPPLVVGNVVLHLQNSPIWYGLPLGLILLIIFSTAFILVFLRRMEQAQEQVRQRIKMDALGRLVAGLAHEIGTPLNSILVIAKDVESSVPAEFQKELGVIANQAKRCGEIVSLLLGYSQTFVRRGEDVQYSPVNLIPWIAETYDLLVQGESQRAPRAVRAPVDFRIEVEGVPEMVSIPQLIFRQVLENLLKNARDAVMGISQPKILVRVYQDLNENELVMIVEDNGPGFTKQEQEQAFEAFFTTKKHGFGTGLGLYMSYYLLSQVGGRIVIEERSGSGARMKVNLPHLDS